MASRTKRLSDPGVDAMQAESGSYGVDMIAHERKQQLHALLWTTAHDDGHTEGELLEAALCYARGAMGAISPGSRSSEPLPIETWPFEAEWMRTNWEEPVELLVKAGAVIAAEIDRLERARNPVNHPIRKNDIIEQVNPAQGDTEDPLAPSASLLAKLASMVAHAEEARSPQGHAADVLALASLRSDPEVEAWMDGMRAKALLPVTR